MNSGGGGGNGWEPHEQHTCTRAHVHAQNSIGYSVFIRGFGLGLWWWWLVVTLVWWWLQITGSMRQRARLTTHHHSHHQQHHRHRHHHPPSVSSSSPSPSSGKAGRRARPDRQLCRHYRQHRHDHQVPTEPAGTSRHQKMMRDHHQQHGYRCPLCCRTLQDISTMRAHLEHHYPPRLAHLSRSLLRQNLLSPEQREESHEVEASRTVGSDQDAQMGPTSDREAMVGMGVVPMGDRRPVFTREEATIIHQ